MANNYCIFSEMIGDITEEEEEWISRFLTSPEDWDTPDISQDDDEADDERFKDWLVFHGFREDGEDLDMDVDCYYPNFQWDLERRERKGKKVTELWLYAEEGFDLDHVINLVVELHKKFRPKGEFTLTWAEYCSKPRIGEFGGGAVAIYGTKVDWCSSYGDSVDMLEKLKEPWSNNLVQFARLIDEIRATGIFDDYPEQSPIFDDLKKSMDLDEEHLLELIGRASEVWKSSKPQAPVRGED